MISNAEVLITLLRNQVQIMESLSLLSGMHLNTEITDHLNKKTSLIQQTNESIVRKIMQELRNEDK